MQTTDRRPYISYYADDFTGATDALDALTSAGIYSVLVLNPAIDPLSLFPGVQAVGFAGMSRTMSPDQMDRSLPAAFVKMKELQPKIAHYKVCSTFDSSPSVGSIGRALEIGMKVFGCRNVPIIVGSPRLGRFVAFGNLFARAGSDPAIHRLDRHPVMKDHPVTPMAEADLRIHLAKQTDVEIDYLYAPMIDREQFPILAGEGKAILCDTISGEQLERIGEWLHRESGGQTLFCVGSSAVETAAAAFIPRSSTAVRTTRQRTAGEAIVVVSGSCSPVSARQVDTARAAGFKTFNLSPDLFVRDNPTASAVETALRETIEAIRRNISVVVYTANGKADEFGGDKRNESAVKARISGTLASLISAVVESGTVSRVCISGGDTSGFVTTALGIDALTVLKPISAGAPLCIGTTRSGLEIEIALKGGQMGQDDYFCRVRDV
jgi:uncharacterized protein YgbK (DUF1537 family)